MKTLKFLTVALAALTLASCSKETSVVDADHNSGQGATLTLNFTDPNTKVGGDATDNADKNMTNFMIFVFRTDGTLDVSPIYKSSATTPEGPSAETLTVTTKAKTVYVIANVGDQTASGGLFAGVKNEAGLKALTKDRIADLGAAGAGKTQIAKTNVLMTGFGTATAFDAQRKATVDVTLQFPLAKIKVVIIDKRKDNKTVAELATAGAVSIVDNNVILLYAGRWVKFFTADAGVDRQVQTIFYSGDIAYPDYSGTGHTTLEATNFVDVATPADWVNNTTTVNHHFFTAANNGAFNDTKTATILTIRSTRVVRNAENDGNEAPETIYYPIKFNDIDAKTFLEAGQSYTVTLTINGDVQAGGAIGVPNPEEDAIPGEITANIIVASWTAATAIDKEFQ